MGMCWVPDCKHYSGKHTCKFYKIPKDKNLAEKWVVLVGRYDATQHSKICSCHFVNQNKENLPTIFKNRENQAELMTHAPQQVDKKLAKLKAEKSNVELESKPSTSAVSNEENSSDFPIEHVDVGSTSCEKTTHPYLNFLPKSENMSENEQTAESEDESQQRNETVGKRCFMDCKFDAPFIKFTPVTLRSCHIILEQRKRHSLKYSDVELPQEVNDTIGYHSKCRNNFNALNTKFRAVSLNESSGSNINMSENEQTAESEDESQQRNETVEKRCFMDCKFDAPFIKFTPVTLRSCHIILEQRKRHSLKYSDVELPHEVNDTIGYHSKCRNNFNVLNTKFRAVSLNESSGSNIYPSPITGKKTRHFASKTPSRSKRAKLARARNLKKYTDLNDLPIEQVDVGSTSFEDTIEPDLHLLPESDEPSLPKRKRPKDMKYYCRLCLNSVNKNQMVCFGDFHDINYPSRSEQFKRNKILQTEMYLRMIRTVMPNFNHDLVYNPIMCNICSTRLQMASDFVEQCMTTQHLIQQYKDRYCPAEKLVSCEDVVYNRLLLLRLPQNNQDVPSNPKKRKIDNPVPQQPTETVSYNEDFQTLENVHVKTEQFEEVENELRYEITPEEVCTIKQEFVEEETMIKTEESEITLPVDTVVKNEPCSTEISDYNIVANEQTSIKQFSNIDIPTTEVDSIYTTNYLVGIPAQFCPPTLPSQYCPPNQPVASETFVSLVNPVTTQSVASNDVDLSLNFQNNQNR